MSTVLAPPTQTPDDAEYEDEAPRRPRSDALWSALTAALATVLSTVAVGSMLSGTRWLSHALGSIGIVLVLGLLLRSLKLPRPAVIVAQFVVCAGYVTALYAGPEAVLGFFPGPDAFGRIGDRLDSGFTTMDTAIPPFTPDNNVAMIAVAGVAATAIAVDALAVAYRRPLLAGAPLLTLYALPAFGLPEGPRTWLFVLPALGLLLLFVGDDRDRLKRWGLGSDGADLAHAGTRRTGMLIGVFVLAVSVVVPYAVPRITAALFDKRWVGLTGEEPLRTLDPLVDMRRNLVRADDVNLMEISSDTQRAGEQYLRAVTLDQFDGTQWRAGDRHIDKFEGDLPAPYGLAPTVAHYPVTSTLVGLEAFRTDYLPMPYPATRVDIDGKWKVDPATGNVVSTAGREQAAAATYTVDSIDLDPSRDDVGTAPPDPALARYLELPTLPEGIAEQAKKVVKGETAPLQIGLKLQNWFRNPKNFTYDLRPYGSGGDAITEFLKSRRGYCEQFASTMAVMARMLGVPARVNVGFTPGAIGGASHLPTTAVGGGRVISAYDAHAWPELYLPNVGWTRFEPTPGDASSSPSVPQWLQDAAPEKPAPQQEPDKSDTKDDSTPPPPEEKPDKLSPPPPFATADSSAQLEANAVDCFTTIGTDDGSVASVGAQVECERPTASAPPAPTPLWKTVLMWMLGFLLVLLLLLAIPRLVRLEIRRRRWKSVAGAGSGAATAAVAEVAWVELRDTALDLGYAWPVARTPRQTAATLTQDAWLTAPAAAALSQVTGLVEAARYSPAGATTADPAGVRTTVETVNEGLAVSAGRSERVYAQVLPRSLRVTVVRPVTSRVKARFRRVTRRFRRRKSGR